MLVLLGAAVFIVTVTGQGVVGGLAPAAAPLREICALRWAAADEPLATIGGAMVCGRELPAGEAKSVFLRTGLYHVLVVSGAHLVLLAELIRRLRPRGRAGRALLLGGLALFALMTGLGAPLVRAGLQMALQFHRPRPAVANILLSVAGALCVQPAWWDSVSLHLSALAALGMSLPLKAWGKGAAVVALTLPVVLPFGSLSAAGALTGLLLSPVVELLLFPLCLVAWLAPPLQPLVNPVVGAGLAALSALAASFGPPLQSPPLLPPATLGLYVLAVAAALIATTARTRLSPRRSLNCAT